MTLWIQRPRGIGAWAALAVFVFDLTYIATGMVWLISEGDPVRRQSLTPADPHLAILEAIIVAICPLMVITMASVHVRAARESTSCSLAALGFMVLLAGVTCSLHFVDLVVVRRIDPTTLRSLSWFVSLPWRWPSVTFALDLFAWDLFFGLSMLFGAAVFKGGKSETRVRAVMFLSGVLCLAGILAPALGDLRFQGIAIMGYAGLGPVVFLLLSKVLSQPQPAPVD